MGTSHPQAKRYKGHTFELVYGQEDVLLVEVNLDTLRIT
jgi:hypothetical protein